MQRIVRYLTAAFVCLTAMALPTCASALPRDSDGCYLLATSGDLFEFADMVRAGQRRINAKLVNNIVMSTSEEPFDWVAVCGSIGRYGGEYLGVFDGRGFTVSGLYLRTPPLKYHGLFGQIGVGGAVRNLKVMAKPGVVRFIWGDPWDDYYRYGRRRTVHPHSYRRPPPPPRDGSRPQRRAPGRRPAHGHRPHKQSRR